MVKSGLSASPAFAAVRLVHRAKQAQRAGEDKMRQREIAVGLNASLQPSHSFGIRAELQLGRPTMCIQW